MAIALPPGAGSEGILRANLKIRGIPFVWQQKDKAVNHPVCRMLLSALSILSEGYRTDKVITVARSGFCTLTEDEGLHLEDYARAHGVEGRRWQRPFTSGENAEETDELRLRLIRPIEELRIRLKEAGNAAASAEAIADFLETENVWNRLQEEEEMLLQHEMYREAIINRQIWKLLMELLEQLGTLLGPRRAAIRDLKYMLESALNPVELAALPEEEFVRWRDSLRPEVTEVLRDEQAFWRERYVPWIGRLQARSYNLFLKGNRIRSGMANYNEVIQIILTLS